MNQDQAFDEVAAPEPQTFTPLQAGGAIWLGVVSLLVSGLLPLLLGALASEHRLSAGGIGRLATLELLSTALVTALAGAFLPPRRLKLIGLVAAMLLAVADLATVGAADLRLLVVRTLAGGPEGVLLWLCVGLIARTRAPQRYAALLFGVGALSQFVVAILCTVWVAPHFGADGCYRLLAALTLLGVAAALVIPGAYATLPPAPGVGLPLRGVAALTAVFCFQAAVAGAGVYLVPLARQAGLGEDVAQTAIACGLAAEILGAGVATLVALRWRHRAVLPVGATMFLLLLGVYLGQPAAWLFIAATLAVGFVSLLMMPFFVPMLIEADASLRTAVQIGGAQLLGGAVGPVLASLAVHDSAIHGAVFVSATLMLLSLGLILASSRGSHRR